jgi:hypothetical protein
MEKHKLPPKSKSLLENRANTDKADPKEGEGRTIEQESSSSWNHTYHC